MRIETSCYRYGGFAVVAGLRVIPLVVHCGSQQIRNVFLIVNHQNSDGILSSAHVLIISRKPLDFLWET